MLLMILYFPGSYGQAVGRRREISLGDRLGFELGFLVCMRFRIARMRGLAYWNLPRSKSRFIYAKRYDNLSR